jgi:hypothetical protein
MTLEVMLAHKVLIATLVSAGCAYAMLRHARQMMFEGVGLSEGGGWAALVLAEFTVSLAALAVALS